LTDKEVQFKMMILINKLQDLLVEICKVQDVF